MCCRLVIGYVTVSTNVSRLIYILLYYETIKVLGDFAI